MPARVLQIPEGCILSDEEIIHALQVLNERKEQGEAGFVLVEGLEPEFYTLKVPKTCVILRDEIIVSLDKLNLACQYGEADVIFTIAGGRLVKKGWITLKDGRSRGNNGALARRLDGKVIMGLASGGSQIKDF